MTKPQTTPDPIIARAEELALELPNLVGHGTHDDMVMWLRNILRAEREKSISECLEATKVVLHAN